jgi:glucose/arabinose dehydrogenase/cytochrome c2
MPRRVAFAVAVMMAAPAALGADSNAGKVYFRQQCAPCHSAEPNDNGGAQGPDLYNVFGRSAASNPGFSYTPALRRSRLTWDSATLDRFLTSPTRVVPESAMVIQVPDAVDRQNLIAYFEEVKRGTFKDIAPPRSVPPANEPPAADAPAGEPDWKRDVPGRAHQIDAARLPAPFATASARNGAKLVEKPAGAQLAVPEGFEVNVFARGLVGPRTMRQAPNGDIFIAETRAGRIRVMRPSPDGAAAAAIDTYATGLVGPFGMQFYPAGPHPRWLYVAETNRVVRYAYARGDSKASASPEVIVPRLYPGNGGGHSTRDITFSPDGRQMYISVGSATNVAEDMPHWSVAEAQAWAQTHGLGAAWDRETNRAVVMAFSLNAGKARKGRLYATGIRNCVGLTVQPVTGALWCTTNERDGLGDDLVPDYSTRVQQGGFYGWPWYYLGNHEDPRLKGQRPDLAGKAIVPDVLYQAHSAPLNLIFYDANSGTSAFPEEYVGDGFVAFHGSWNRAQRTGQKVVRLRMNHGVPTGEYDDFLVGFIVDADSVWGRPVGLVVAADGSLLVSEDGNDLVYRVSYVGRGHH